MSSSPLMKSIDTLPNQEQRFGWIIAALPKYPSCCLYVNTLHSFQKECCFFCSSRDILSLLKHSLFIWFQQLFVNRLCSLDGCLIDATLQLFSLDVDANVFESVWAFAFRQQVTGPDWLKDRPPRPVKIAESDIDVSSVLSLLKPTFWALSSSRSLCLLFTESC